MSTTESSETTQPCQASYEVLKVKGITKRLTPYLPQETPHLSMNTHTWVARVPLTLSLILFCSGCTVGPDYVPPAISAPKAFKETIPGWKPAAPGTIDAKVPWWETFNEPRLSALEVEVLKANQNLAQAKAQYDQARALIEGAQATFLPSLGVGVSETRGKTPLTSATSSTSPVYNTHNGFGSVSWETNLWGGTTRSVEAAKAGFEASAAALSAAQLVATSALAQGYFQIRMLDHQQHLLETATATYEQLLSLTQIRMKAGAASQLDVIAAENQYKAALNQASNNTIARSQTEHALAVLLGKSPDQFRLEASPVPPSWSSLPPIPLGVPSAVLERRPDVAQGERLMAQANANIGLAKSAFFPDLTLGASGGYESHKFSRWITAPMQYWALGPQLATTLFDGGSRSARLEGAKAAYGERVAAYKQTVLTAFQEVEDQLANLRSLEAQGHTQEEAVGNAKKNLSLVEAKYQAGMASQIDVLNAQGILYPLQITQATLTAQRLTSRVALLKALGGSVGKGEK